MNEEKEIRSIWKLIILHLVPGIVLSIIYLFLLKKGNMTEYPRIVLLGLAVIFAQIPILGYLFYVARKEEGSFNIFKILGLKNKLKIKEYIFYAFTLLMISGILMMCSKPLSNLILNTVFSWIPNWFNYVQDMSQFSRYYIIITLAVSFFIFTIIGPVIEEFYFRGFLLARMKWMGKYSVLLNVILFAIYHFWSPWLIVARVISCLPVFYWVYKKDSLRLSILVHCLLNFTDVVSLMMLL